MTHGSLFAGIGGFDLGFERAGIRTVWQVEIDEYCRRVLERHFPEAKRYADIRECGAHNLERVDIITGGFPCQDISVVGHMVGIEGSRSGLWSEMRRIVCELRPGIVVVENVPALLVGGIGRVLGELAASGYDAEWDCIPAIAFGALHQRDRIFIVAYAQHDGRDRRGGANEYQCERQEVGRSEQSGGNGNSREMADADSINGQIGGVYRPDAPPSGNGDSHARGSGTDDRRQPRTAENGEMANPVGRRCQQLRGQVPSEELCRGQIPGAECGSSCRWRTQWAVEPDVGRVANGVPSRVDRLKGLGNAVVPQIAQWLGERLLQAEKEMSK